MDLSESTASATLAEHLARITEIMYATGRADFFDRAAQHLGEMLGARYVLVGELKGYPVRKVHALALWSEGAAERGQAFDLKGSASQDLLRGPKTGLFVAEKAGEAYPRDPFVVQHGIQALCGAPLIDAAGNPIGVILAYHDAPLAMGPPVDRLLPLAATCVASEILRLRAEQDAKFLVNDLQHRMKELSCFYGITESIRTRESVRDIVCEVVKLLPPTWQHPEVARARVILDDIRETSEAFEESRWGQSSVIVVNGQARGMVQVYYVEDRSPPGLEGPFLPSERNLLDAVARTLGEAIQRREAEAETREKRVSLQQERNRLETILRSIGDGVVVTDDHDSILLMNRAARTMLGIRGEEPFGAHFLSLLPDAEFVQTWERSKAEHRNLAKEEFNLADPELRTLWATRNRIPYLVDDRPGYVTILQDVTQQREIDQMKTDFVSSVSHELRTPMTSIKGFAATLLKHPDMEPERSHRFLQIIGHEADRLLAMIEELLMMARIESGKLELIEKPLDLPAIVDSVVSSLEHEMAKRGLKCSIRTAPDLKTVHGDPVKVQAIVSNLVHNAIKFSHSDGQIQVRATNSGTGVCLEIEDDGIGIPHGEHGRIFERFYRVHRPDMQHAGTGLGLFIVKEFVELHGGTVRVESTPEHGTRFSVELPLHPVSRPVAEGDSGGET